MTRSASTIGCQGSVTITATIFDTEDTVQSGTLVSFTVNGVSVGTVPTAGATATITITAPVGFDGTLVITATSGNLSASISVTVDCPTPGPPATITLQALQTTVACGGQVTVFATVRDANGRPVLTGTPVSFTVTSALGTITPSAPVFGAGGVAQAVFTAFPRAAGTAQIIATAGAATASTTITVTCATAATATQPPTVVAPTVVVPTAPPATPPGGGAITPPSTGDAGLK